MFWRGWLGLVVAWGFGGALYGLIVSLRMGLAGAARDSFLLMGYVALFFVILGSLLFLTRAGIRALLRTLRREKHSIQASDRSLPVVVVASLGGFVVMLAVLLALGDVLITLSFRQDTSRTWLVVRDLLFLAGGGAMGWLLCGPVARRLEPLLRRVRDPAGWKALLVFVAVMLVVALLAPWLGAPTPRWKRERSGPPEGLQPAVTGLKVLVFGVDGATWRVYEPLIRDGQLPTTASLLERGVAATPISPPPQVSPAIWTTIVTGRLPEEHGVREYLLVSLPGLVKFPFEALADDLVVVPFFFVGLGYYIAEVAEGIPPTSDQVRTKTLWHMVEDGGGGSLVLGWPCTWPAEPVHGLTVSDRFGPNEFDVFSHSHQRAAGGIHPAQAEQRLQPLMVDSGGDPGPMLRRLAGLSDTEVRELSGYTINPMLPTPVSLLTTAYDADMSLLNFMRAELARGAYELALVMINGPDMTMHAFWKDRFPADFGLSAGRHPAWGRLIDAYHRLVDERMGAILRVAGENTVVMVISDHGMAADPGSLIWSGNHAPEALFIMAGGPLRAGVRLQGLSYLDVTPTVLYLLGYPVPEDLGGRVRTDLVEEEFLRKFPVRTIPSYEEPSLETPAGGSG
jgi:hypothetical protein